MNTPFLIINPKSYLTGKELLALAKEADSIASMTAVKIYFTAPFADLSALSLHTKHLIITAQHMDSLDPGRGMGHVLGESLKASGATATFLNHAERPLSLSVIKETLKKASTLNFETILCADSTEEAVLLAKLNPTILLAEPTDLIGTGQTASEAYMTQTIQKIKAVNPKVLIMIASGVSSKEDVYKVMHLGADGTGATSGIIKAKDPVLEIKAWVNAIEEAKGLNDEDL